MKKVLFAVIAVAALASCKKDYTCSCTSGGYTISQDYLDLTKDQADAQQSSCEASSLCTWSVK